MTNFSKLPCRVLVCNFTFRKIQDENYIRLLPANRHWERLKYITAFKEDAILGKENKT
jgi:hypothetical protein